MKLPKIIWAKFGRYVRSTAVVDSGVRLDASGGYVNVDLEAPDATHIKMKESEIHIGLNLASPTGKHDPARTSPVNVPEEELQKGRNEKNPIYKVQGDFKIELTADSAAGLGLLLKSVVLPGLISYFSTGLPMIGTRLTDTTSGGEYRRAAATSLWENVFTIEP